VYILHPQEERLGFPWIPLAESGLFNELRRIQTKKFFPLAASASSLSKGCGPLTKPPMTPASGNRYSTDSGYLKDLAPKITWAEPLLLRAC
jgi:hypothetical protein